MFSRGRISVSISWAINLDLPVCRVLSDFVNARMEELNIPGRVRKFCSKPHRMLHITRASADPLMMPISLAGLKVPSRKMNA